MANTLSRRSFLATTSAAASAAAVLPEAAVAIVRPQAKLMDRDFYFLHTHGKHTRFDGAPEDPHHMDSQTVRRRFVPLARPDRFRMIAANWDHCSSNSPRGYFTLDREERNAIQDAQFAAESVIEDAVEQPCSYVELTAHLKHVDERWLAEEVQWHTRESGLAKIAAWNRETWEAIAIGDPYRNMVWCMLVEYGEPCIEVPDFALMEVSESGVGLATLHCYCPVRITIPTEAELDQYEIPGDGVEGGADNG